MKKDKKINWQRIAGDGSSLPLPEGKFNELREEFRIISEDAGRGVNDRRQLSEDARFCKWPGQSPDGRKHDDALEDGKKAFPFDGASDVRKRTADGIAQEQVIVIMAAVMRMQLGVKGTEALDAEAAADNNVLWDWLRNNNLGAEWFVEMSKFVNNRQAGAPGVGILQVWWDEEKQLREETVTTDEVLEKAVALATTQTRAPLTPEQAQDLQDLVFNAGRDDEFAALIRALWPEMGEARAAKVVDALNEKGEARFAYPTTLGNRLRMKSRRLFDDIFTPQNTSDPNRSRVWFVREFFSEPELREKEARGEFKPGRLEQVLKHEGESGWKHYCQYDPISGDYSAEPVEREWDKDAHRGEYELITAIFRASNDLGIPGIYTVTFHACVDEPLTDMELYTTPRGIYPIFVSAREIITDSLWDSRGVCELSATQQSALKQLHDSFLDHVQLTTLPTFEAPATRPKLGLVFRPLGIIKTQRQGEIRPIQMGQYPAANDKAQAGIERELGEYFGRMVATNTPDWIRLYQQSLVDGTFVTVAQIVRYSLELAWQYLPDATLSRVLGREVVKQPDMMKYDIIVSFEAGMLSLEFLAKVGEMIGKYVLAWDTMSTVQRDKLVRWFFSAISPTLARELLIPAKQAQQSEIEDEQRNFTLISAGVEPVMIPDGQNYGLRLQVQMDIGQKNPEAWEKLTPKSREILQARLAFLQQQVKQEENKMTGRLGTKPALQPDPVGEALTAAGMDQ